LAPTQPPVRSFGLKLVKRLRKASGSERTAATPSGRDIRSLAYGQLGPGVDDYSATIASLPNQTSLDSWDPAAFIVLVDDSNDLQILYDFHKRSRPCSLFLMLIGGI